MESNLILRQGTTKSDFPLRMLVRSDMVGAIIGRSGSTIKQITQQSKARIDVHREDSMDQHEKVITINGSPDSCSTACFKILDIIMKEKMLLNNKSSSANSNNSEDHDAQASANNDNNNNNHGDVDTNTGNDMKQQEEENTIQSDTEVQLRILAHNNYIGRLIGRSGSSIKKIMDQTLTKINVSGNSMTDCTQERTITVTGNLEQVRQAEKIISSKLRAASLSDYNTQIQAMSQQPYLFNNVPLSYMPGHYAQNPILSSLVNSQTGHSGHAMSRSLNPHQNQLPNQTLYPNSANYLSMYPNMGVLSAGHPPFGFDPSSSTDVEKETVHIYIPSTMVGAIIGKSGSAIKEMISTSGASIKVVAASTTTLNTTAANQPSDSNSSDKSPTSTTPAATDKVDSSLPKQEPAKPYTDGLIANGTNSGATNDTEANRSENDVAQSKCTQDSRTKTSVSQHPTHNHTFSRQQNNSSDSFLSTRKVTIYGTPSSQSAAQYLIYRKVAIESGKSDISLMVEIQVPSHLVGKIIGKAGVTVKSIQKQTRTTIRLPDDKPHLPSAENGNDTTNATAVDTTVQITGEFQNSQSAQRYIRNLIKERF